ncbi:MAG: sigma-70 family RNA polymerase sigma factor [Pirellulaceae bacterium]
MESESQSKIDELGMLKRAASQGDASALNEVLMKYRDGLVRMVQIRMNDRLKGRLDASDVIQDTFVEANRALADFLANPVMPVNLWLRHLAGQKLIQAHRTHLGSQKRDAAREESILGGVPSASSVLLADVLVADITTPSQIVVKQESREELLAALESMDELDREVLTLRHFEQMNSRETAEVLGMTNDAVKKRYVRALDKLQKLLADRIQP